MPFTLELNDFERPVIRELIHREISRLRDEEHRHYAVGDFDESDALLKKIEQLTVILGRLGG